MSLPDALERAASELAAHADAVRDANGDPERLLETLSATGASEVLAWLLTSETAAGEELALAWSEADAGAAPLQSLDADTLTKPGRKALRKALHRLRSRGIEVEAARPQAVVAKLGEIDESIEAALMSPLDPRGSRMVYLVASQPSGGAKVYEALLDELHGIVEFHVYSTGRSRARKFLRELAGRRNASMLEIEPDALRVMLARAAERQPSSRPVPRAFIEQRSQLGLDATAATPEEQVVAALGAGDGSERERLERIVERVKTGALGPWPPAGETLTRAAEPIGEAAKSSLIVSGDTERERNRELLERAAADIFDEAFTAATVRRLRQTAFALWRHEREEDARDCLAAAAAFEANTSEQPVARAFAEVWFGRLLENLASAQAQESAEDAGDTDGDGESLLVKP
jgi:hypothetical protein